MSTTIIAPPAPNTTSPFDSIRQTREDGSEFWSGRNLMPLLGYDKWERFSGALDRAIASMDAQGVSVDRNASRLREPIGKTEREDFHLSRFACYLVAMNGDARKPEVAAAQAYFAIRTREAEVREEPKQLSGPELMAAALIEAQATLEATSAENHQLRQKAKEDAPKVSYVDEFVYEDDDLRTWRTLAAELHVGEDWLRSLLIERKWIYRDTHTRRRSRGGSETRYRYSAYAEKKRYFQIRVSHEAPLFKGELMHTLKITPPGAEAISRLVKKELAA